MSRISAWFDRHMKTRIALQLVLDGLPFLSLCGSVGCFYGMWSADSRVLGGIHAVLLCISAIGFVFSVPILFVAARMRDKADAEFASCPICKIPSALMRGLSCISAAFSIPVILALIGSLI